MKQILTVFLVFFIGTTIFAADPICPVPGSWSFCGEFSDEFNGNSIDHEKWFDFNPSWDGRKPGFFARDNVSVTDGCLTLKAREIRTDELTLERKERGADQFATSIVKSKKRIRYGYFEARCRSMKANLCNAFWLYDPLDAPLKYREGYFSEEIDIFEVFGKAVTPASDHIYFTTVHRFYTPYVESIANFKKIKLDNYQKTTKVDFDFSADFHRYGFLWTPSEMTWFIDGKPVFSRSNDYFNTALHIMFDCEIMKGWVGLPNKEDLPAEFKIDYLRVWQMKR